MAGKAVEYSFDLTPLDSLKAYADRFQPMTLTALEQESAIELREMKRRTPVESGTLRDSGELTDATITSDEISIGFRFGGEAEDYAFVVHEDLEAHHDIGQAKFMESVIVEAAPHISRRVLTRVEERAKREVIKKTR